MLYKCVYLSISLSIYVQYDTWISTSNDFLYVVYFLLNQIHQDFIISSGKLYNQSCFYELIFVAKMYCVEMLIYIYIYIYIYTDPFRYICMYIYTYVVCVCVCVCVCVRESVHLWNQYDLTIIYMSLSLSFFLSLPMYIYLCIYTYTGGGSPCGEIAKMLDCCLKVNEFKLQLHNYMPFQSNS